MTTSTVKQLAMNLTETSCTCNIIQAVVAVNISTNRKASSTKRTVSSMLHDSSDVSYGRIELDSHADTIVLGSNATVLHYTGRECDVAPYSESYDPICNVPIVTGATAITSPHTGETTILVFHEAIWMGKHLNHCLLNPNQLRHHGVTVQDNPYAEQSMHLTSHDEKFVLPMKADGAVIYFDGRTPTDHELAHCRHVTLSSRAAWNPRDVQFPTPTHHVEEEMYNISATTMFDLTTVGDSRHISQMITERLLSEIRVDGNATAVDVPVPRTFATGKRHSDVSAQELSERWFIGIAQAYETIKVTTQNYTRSAILPLSRRYRADRIYEKPLLRGDYYTDTMDGRCKSLDGNRYAQIMANKDFFAVAYPMSKKSEAGESLRRFIHDYGRPERLTFDGSQEQCGRKTDFMRNVNKYSIDWHVTEPQRSNHNFAEGVIREVRKKWFRVMVRKSVPQRLWDYGLQWVCDIQVRTSNSARDLDGKCPLERVTGETVDISEYLDFGFYDWVWYRENAGLGETKLGRWLGVSHRIGTLMSFWVLAASGKVISRTTVQRVTNLEIQVDENKKKCEEFTAAIKERIGANDVAPYDENGDVVVPEDWDDPAFREDFLEEFGKSINNPNVQEADTDFTPDTYDDTYLNMELALPRDGAEVQFGRVVKRLRDKDGLPIGTANDNPILDTRMYEVEFQDGHRASLAANAIAENLFA